VHEVLAVLLVECLQPLGVASQGVEQDGEVVVVALVGLDGPAGGGGEDVTVCDDPIFG
jgi:hypothetical protein